MPEYVINNRPGKSKAYGVAILLILPVTGICIVIFCIAAMIWVAAGEGWYFACITGGIGIPFGILVFFYGWYIYKVGMARYRFQKKGFYVTFPFEHEIYVDWNEIQQVCLVYTSYTTRGKARAVTNIFIVRNGVKKSDANKRWPESFIHYRKIFHIEYTPDRYRGIKEVCPHDIVDLRDTLPYRIFPT